MQRILFGFCLASAFTIVAAIPASAENTGTAVGAGIGALTGVGAGTVRLRARSSAASRSTLTIDANDSNALLAGIVDQSVPELVGDK